MQERFPEMYQFEIHGVPIPQQHTRWAKGFTHSYNPNSRDIERIRWQIKPTCPDELLCVPVELSLWFFLPLPKSAPSITKQQMINRVILPDKKPDADNLAYLITNALKGFVYDDDKRVCAQHVYKFYAATPRTVIQVRPISQIDPVGYHQDDVV